MWTIHKFVHKDTHCLEVCSVRWHPCYANQLVFTRYGSAVTRHKHSEPPTHSKDVWTPLRSHVFVPLRMSDWSCCLAQSVPWLLAPFESDPTQLTHLLGKKRCAFHFWLSLCPEPQDYSFHDISYPYVSFQGPVQHQTEGSASSSIMVALQPARWFPSFSSLQ